MTKENAIKLFNDKQIRTHWDDEQEKWYFSIVDVVGALSESIEPQSYWRKLKQRLKEEGNETVTNCHGLKMKQTVKYILILWFLVGYSGLYAQNLDKHLIKDIKNPMIDEPGMADPHMLVINDTCYLFTGHDIGVGISDWVMPDWRIYKSADLQKWTYIGTISPKDNIMGEGNTNCWAGDIAIRNGKYYWYYSNRKEGAGVMVADKPEGPYKDALGKYLIDSFDPTIFVDDDNTPYIIYGEGTYKIARMKESMIELDEKPKEITIKRTSYFPETDKNSLHKHNGIYYLSCSGYYATSKNIYGPYETQGVVGKGFGLDTGYGHGDFFVWKGDWYHTWCRYRNRSADRIRDCFIAPTYYEENGIMYDDTRHINEKYKSSGIKEMREIIFKVNPEKTFQSMDYFTASDAWSGNFVGSYWGKNEKEQIAKWLFSQKLDETGSPEGIGLSMWRVNIGAGTLEQDSADIMPFQRRAESFLDASGNGYDWSKCKGHQYFMEKAVAYGCNNFLLFSNSPIVQWTKNGRGWSASDNKANIRPDAYGKFASYMTDVADYFIHTKGWNISYISPINEPQVNWISPRQEGSPWGNSEIRKMFVELDKALSAKGLDNVKMLAGESASLSYMFEESDKLRERFEAGEAPDRQIQTFFDPESPHYMGELKHLPRMMAGHSYHSHLTDKQLKDTRLQLKEVVDQYQIDFHQSEWCLLPGISTPMDGFPADWQKGNYAGMDVALLMGRIIYGDIVFANAKSWGYWKAMEMDGNHALISLYGDLMKGGAVRPNKLLWALGNYSYFIRPGYLHIALEAGAGLSKSGLSVVGSAFEEAGAGLSKSGLTVVGSAFISPKKDRIVIVFVNSSYDAVSAIAELPEAYSARKFEMSLFCTNEHMDLAKCPCTSSGEIKATLLPRSITSLVLDF